MGGKNQFDWVKFYKELSGILLKYKYNRQELVIKVKQIYENTGINMPLLEKDNNIVDIDPFSFFGIFNKSSMREENRIKILSAIKELFDVDSPVPASFDSIPVLNNQNATYYYFIDQRGDNDIDDLWNLFESAYKYAEDPTADRRVAISKNFDNVINKKGNGNSKITMGLYWIAPSAFLNLDQRNIWYIYKSGKISKNIVDTLPEIEAKIPADKYFDIVEKLRAYLQSDQSDLKDFKELSLEAWKCSKQESIGQISAIKSNVVNNAEVAVADEDLITTRYWIYSPGNGAEYWEEFYNAGIMCIGWDEIGDLSVFNNKDEMKQAMKHMIDPSKSYINAAHATWQFANEMKPGDIVFAKKGMYKIVGRGIVESEYIFDPKLGHDRNVRKVNWTHKGEWPHPGQAVMKTLTNITAYTEYVNDLNALFQDEMNDDVEETVDTDLQPYNADMFLKQVYMDSTKYESIVAWLMRKKNIILQGAPGVGKTFAARKLAYSIMGVIDPSRVMMVQFHQSYSYEDFIMGFRPSQKGGFELKHGSFYDFCKAAEVDSENTPYFFIIDEINRGNLSKIFGELFMLIETDKRGIGLKLLYADEMFSVPKNVYIIGMMNTADRSLAMMDYALRRRFAFINIEPGFNTKGFIDYRISLHSDRFNRLIDKIEELNQDIATDDSLGEGFCIGHSYFCELKEASYQTLSGIIEFEIAPLLKEYWFDEPEKAKTWIEDLRSAIK
ncbi:5-methylcytosine-specific restriction enzyme B [Eubacterium ruminantium]|nr:5-methylcytosine-specific restriction enzyme B [Eubacterium ruminantium]